MLRRGSRQARSRTLMASMAYSTWKSRPSGEKVFTPRSYSVLRKTKFIPKSDENFPRETAPPARNPAADREIGDIAKEMGRFLPREEHGGARRGLLGLGEEGFVGDGRDEGSA